MNRRYTLSTLFLMGAMVLSAQNATYYQDYDGDGYGNAAVVLESPEPLLGYVADATDCNDSVSVIYPTAPEFCNGADESCDGIIDENPVTGPTYYLDADADGFGDQYVPLISCSVPEGYSTNFLDCDDSNAALNPLTPWYGDVDGDGYGNPNQVLNTCTPPENFIANCGDCNDQDAAVNAEAVEVANNQIDEDCNGIVDDACARPTTSKVVHYSSTSVVIFWNAANDAQKYQIQTRPLGGVWSGFTGSLVPYVKLDGLTPGATYEYRIRTQCNGTWTSLTNPLQFVMTSGSGTCGKPQSGDQYAVSPYTTRFFWNYVPNVNRYRFRIRPLGGVFQLRNVPKVNGVAIPETGIAGLMPGTSYQYQVQALCGTGTSASDWSTFSTTITFTTPAVNCSTLPPANVGGLQPIYFMQTDAPEVQVFPNPTDGMLNIQTVGGAVPALLEVYSLSGNLLMEARTTNTMNVSALPVGMYLMRVTTSSNAVFSQSFIRI